MMKSAGIVLLIAMVGLAGCASKTTAQKVDPRTIDWNQRVGSYFYEQAVADLGKPDVLADSASGKTAEWVLKRSPRMSLGFGVGGGSIGGHSGVGVGVGGETPLPAHGENLRLKFDATGKLTEWTRLNY